MYSTPLKQRIESLVEKDSLSLSKDMFVSDAVRTMKERGVSSVLVTSCYSRPSEAITEPMLLPIPIEGIVTERDVLYRVVANRKDPVKITLGEIMSSPIIAVDESLLLKDAISLMRRKHIRRLLVTSSKKREELGSNIVENETSHEKEFNEVVPIGIVTLMAIAGNVPEESLDLAEVEIPSASHRPSVEVGDSQYIDHGRPKSGYITINCPYCESKFNNKGELSVHIDRIHLGNE
jgi:CBS domain-containing protein